MTMPDNAATPLLTKFAETERESHIPVTVRDTPLPKLISGELWGKTGEPYVAAVTQ